MAMQLIKLLRKIDINIQMRVWPSKPISRFCYGNLYFFFSVFTAEEQNVILNDHFSAS